MACAALSRQAMRSPSQEVLCSAYFLSYNSIGAFNLVSVYQLSSVYTCMTASYL